MQRFGRSAQQRLKDRWGGGFILATILALCAAYFLGDSLGKWINNKSVTTDGSTAQVGSTAKTGNQANMAMEPQEFKMHFVQVGAFLSGKNARDMVDKLSAQGYAAVIAPKNNSGFQAVWVGPYMDSKMAEDAKAKLAEGGMKPVMMPKAVGYNTAAVPAAATGNGSNDARMVIDGLNTYIHEVAMWLDNRSQNMASDTSMIVTQGRELADMASKLAGDKDTHMQALAAMATKASTNAAAIENLTDAQGTEQPFQAAMTDYLSLVDQYNAFQTGK
ncbi:MAG TPA: SPOR domain-containing protein [Symbiobacteriaceae bacterium]|nr:SPOR domain-containing protein [Symbiobacteriaceae bacterium]